MVKFIFFFLHRDVQLFQHHLWKTVVPAPFVENCFMVLPLFVCKRSVDFHLCGSVSGLSVLFHWFIHLLFVQYHSLDYRNFRVSKSSEKAMATHSSTLAWEIPWMEEPGGLQSMGSRGVRHDFTFIFTFHFHALEKEMAIHSSSLAWRIPGPEEPGGRRSMGLHRIGHDWHDLAAAAAE